ncbi:MAG: hypothetical protein HOI23_00310 [Deltaproteobacteria bacterium]|jgi:perosamine synthetase|nr:hypothetical protein [Deltaproteobacteria bacterium]MBT6434836.1 hypothetical protein [Deltaproteobacteria bacterium]MBT6489809.1 hypothetical protein [Deltaproteobacteria bacterium]
MLYSRYRIASGLSFYFRCLISILTLEFLHKRRVPAVERELRELTQEKNLIAVPQARVGLYLYLKEIIEPGDEVLTSAYTLIDMVNMIICAGGKPVFVDTGARHYHICLEDLERKITPATKVLVLPHLYGTSADIGKIVSICKNKNILLFEDCAQAVGASNDGRMLGTFGDAGVYSFGALKNVNALFGGALVIKDKTVLNNIHKTVQRFPLMSFGKIFGKLLFCLFYDLLTHPWVYTPLASTFMNMLDKNGHVDKDAVKRTKIPPSYLSQMTSMQATLVLAGLKTWQNQAKQSRQIASHYSTAISLQGETLHHPAGPSGAFNTYLQFPIWVDPSNRELKKWLRTRQVDINVDFFRDVSSLDCFAEYATDCPNTKHLLEHLALLPTYPRQDSAYTRRVSKALEDFDSGSL